MGNHSRINEINDAIRTNVWYELKRQRIKIPYPVQDLYLHRPEPRSVHEDHDEARAILRNEPLFQCLSEEQLDQLVKQAHLNHFGRGERVIEEGAEGESMFILLRGTAQVSISKNGSLIPVATLSSGDCFGEMSLLTGEPRSATVSAAIDCEVLEIGVEAFRRVVVADPAILERVTAAVAARRAGLELHRATRSAPAGSPEAPHTFLERVRQFLRLST